MQLELGTTECSSFTKHKTLNSNNDFVSRASNAPSVERNAGHAGSESSDHEFSALDTRQREGSDIEQVTWVKMVGPEARAILRIGPSPA